MHRPLHQWLVVILLTFAIGGHWAVLQSVAWVGMVASYSQNSTLREALLKTFDGKHPCALCKTISAGKKSEKKTEFTPQVKQLGFVSARTVFVFCPPHAFWLQPESRASMWMLTTSPPSPPPRSLQG